MKELPLVRLSLVSPLLSALEQLGQDGEAVLANYGFNAQAVHQSDVFVPAPVMYAIVEGICEASGDPYFGVHVGETMNLVAWPPLHEAITQSANLGEMLLKFILDANEHASSITYTLKTQGPRTTFLSHRVTTGGVKPSHNDGFGVSYLLKIIRLALGKNWHGEAVLVRVCDPSVIPPDYLGIRIAASDPLKADISFPSHWLFEKMAVDINLTNDGTRVPNIPSVETIEALHQALRPLLSEQLDANKVASLFGMSPRTLARKLSQQGTSLGKELRHLRYKAAQALLCQPDIPIAEVGRQVGYPDPAVFARAFRSWAGKSPNKFRRELRNE